MHGFRFFDPDQFFAVGGDQLLNELPSADRSACLSILKLNRHSVCAGAAETCTVWLDAEPVEFRECLKGSYGWSSGLDDFAMAPTSGQWAIQFSQGDVGVIGFRNPKGPALYDAALRSLDAVTLDRVPFRLFPTEPPLNWWIDTLRTNYSEPL